MNSKRSINICKIVELDEKVTGQGVKPVETRKCSQNFAIQLNPKINFPSMSCKLFEDLRLILVTILCAPVLQ